LKELEKQDTNRFITVMYACPFHFINKITFFIIRLFKEFQVPSDVGGRNEVFIYISKV